MSERKYIIGCDCYLRGEDGYFCSRSCRAVAIEEKILPSDDFDNKVSNLKLKKESLDKLKLLKNKT